MPRRLGETLNATSIDAWCDEVSEHLEHLIDQYEQMMYPFDRDRFAYARVALNRLEFRLVLTFLSSFSDPEHLYDD